MPGVISGLLWAEDTRTGQTKYENLCSYHKYTIGGALWQGGWLAARAGGTTPAAKGRAGANVASSRVCCMQRRRRAELARAARRWVRARWHIRRQTRRRIRRA